MRSEQIRSEIASCRRKISAYEQEIRDLQSLINEQESALSQAQASKRSIESGWECSKNSIARIKGISNAKTGAAFAASLASKFSSTDFLNAVDAYENAIKAMRDEIDDNYSQIENYRRSINSLYRQIDSLNAALNKALDEERIAAAKTVS